jgi:Type II secretion system (T2SS), protein E, N-terminal domain
MSAADEETAYDDASGRALAEKWKLEYVEAYAVSIDPHALSLIGHADCKRLRAVPLAATGRAPLVAVSTPGKDRFDEIRRLTGKHTRFAIVSDRTLDALLSSRMFADPAAAAAAVAAAAERRDHEPELHDDHQDVGGASSFAGVDHESLVEAMVAALQRVPSGPAAPVALPVGEDGQFEGSIGDLIGQIDATMGVWSSVRNTLAGIGAELEEAKRAAREAKEQLSVAHAENDQHLNRVRALEAELNDSQALVASAKARLQDAAQLLLGGASTSEESHELL